VIAAENGALLKRVLVTGVAGLPDLDLDLGPLAALVGPRGSGKSQLLSAIAWLIAGRPRMISAVGAPVTRVGGDLMVDGQTARLKRSPGAGLRWDLPRSRRSALPACSYLRARDRFSPPRAPDGSVGQRLADLAGRATSDAVAAEALVSAVEACCRECVSGEILLIEEPELLLTPQAQRYLYRLLRRFADGGNQVLYSTRSAAFVDAAHHDEIVRLDLRRGRRSVRHTDPHALSEAERVRLAAEFDHERSEMFFARAVVLVEGQTERLSLPFVFRALGHDPDAEGIAIVEAGGKSNLPLAARLLRQLAIPFVVVFDADRGAASAALDAEIRKATGEAPVIRLEPDFEAAAGIAAHDDKVLHAWRRFATAPAAEIPPALVAIVSAAVGLGHQPGERMSPS
jgi:predicted ATPase